MSDNLKKRSIRWVLSHVPVRKIRVGQQIDFYEKEVTDYKGFGPCAKGIGKTPEEAEANAQLIAAAPELLEALEGISRMGGDFAKSFHTKAEIEKQLNFVAQLAKEAIAKATSIKP